MWQSTTGTLWMRTRCTVITIQLSPSKPCTGCPYDSPMLDGRTCARRRPSRCPALLPFAAPIRCRVASTRTCGGNTVPDSLTCRPCAHPHKKECALKGRAWSRTADAPKLRPVVVRAICRLRVQSLNLLEERLDLVVPASGSSGRTDIIPFKCCQLRSTRAKKSPAEAFVVDQRRGKSLLQSTSRTADPNEV